MIFFGAATLLLLATFHEKHKAARLQRVIGKIESCNQEKLSRPVVATVLDI